MERDSGVYLDFSDLSLRDIVAQDVLGNQEFYCTWLQSRILVWCLGSDMQLDISNISSWEYSLHRRSLSSVRSMYVEDLSVPHPILTRSPKYQSTIALYYCICHGGLYTYS